MTSQSLFIFFFYCFLLTVTTQQNIKPQTPKLQKPKTPKLEIPNSHQTPGGNRRSIQHYYYKQETEEQRITRWEAQKLQAKKLGKPVKTNNERVQRSKTPHKGKPKAPKQKIPTKRIKIGHESLKRMDVEVPKAKGMIKIGHEHLPRSMEMKVKEMKDRIVHGYPERVYRKKNEGWGKKTQTNNERVQRSKTPHKGKLNAPTKKQPQHRVNSPKNQIKITKGYVKSTTKYQTPSNRNNHPKNQIKITKGYVKPTTKQQTPPKKPIRANSPKKHGKVMKGYVKGRKYKNPQKAPVKNLHKSFKHPSVQRPKQVSKANIRHIARPTVTYHKIIPKTSMKHQQPTATRVPSPKVQKFTKSPPPSKASNQGKTHRRKISRKKSKITIMRENIQRNNLNNAAA